MNVLRVARIHSKQTINTKQELLDDAIFDLKFWSQFKVEQATIDFIVNVVLS